MIESTSRCYNSEHSKNNAGIGIQTHIYTNQSNSGNCHLAISITYTRFSALIDSVILARGLIQLYLLNKINVGTILLFELTVFIDIANVCV